MCFLNLGVNRLNNNLHQQCSRREERGGGGGGNIYQRRVGPGYLEANLTSLKILACSLMDLELSDFTSGV